MKKVFLLSLLLLSSCSNNNESILSRITESDESSSISTTSEIPLEEHYLHELEENEYKSFYKYYYQKLTTYKSYKAVTKGVTKSVVLGFINVDQSIDATVIKNKEYGYFTNASHSDFANTEHEAYYHNDKSVYKDYGENEYHTSSLENYLNKYGFYFYDHLIEGFIINEETITNIAINKEEDNYLVSLDLDIETSTNNVKIQMKEFGGLDNYPSFKNINLKLLLQDDYTPIYIALDASYDASKGVGSSCHQTYQVDFSLYNENIEIPGLEKIKELFN